MGGELGFSDRDQRGVYVASETAKPKAESAVPQALYVRLAGGGVTQWMRLWQMPRGPGAGQRKTLWRRQRRKDICV